MYVWGWYFQGEGQEKILLCKGHGGSLHENKNIGGCVLSTQPDQQNRPQCKNAQKKCKNYQTLKEFSSLVSLTRHFTKFIFLQQLTAMPQFNMQNMLLFFSIAVIMIRTLYFICIIFVKNILILLVLTVIHQGSYFPFFCLHPVGQTFVYPSKFCNHLKHSAK